MPQSRSAKRLTKGYYSRSYHVGTQRFQEIKTKVISFIHRTAESLQKALIALRNRYKSVRVERKLVKGLYIGQVIVTL